MIITLGPVVRRADNQRINPYPVDKVCLLSNQNQERANFIRWIGIYPLRKVIHSSYNRAQVFNVHNMAAVTARSSLASCFSLASLHIVSLYSGSGIN